LQYQILKVVERLIGDASGGSDHGKRQIRVSGSRELCVIVAMRMAAHEENTTSTVHHAQGNTMSRDEIFTPDLSVMLLV
jgi:hypothetical protein